MDHNAKKRLATAGRDKRGSTGSPKPQKRSSKRARVRTKTCAKCFTPCTLITRCKLRARDRTTYICDICWPTYCDANPDYRYEGTWQSGKIIDPPAKNEPEKTNRPQTKAVSETAPESKPAPNSIKRFRKRGRREIGRLVRREGGQSLRPH